MAFTELWLHLGRRMLIWLTAFLTSAETFLWRSSYCNRCCLHNRDTMWTLEIIWKVQTFSTSTTHFLTFIGHCLNIRSAPALQQFTVLTEWTLQCWGYAICCRLLIRQAIRGWSGALRYVFALDVDWSSLMQLDTPFGKYIRPIYCDEHKHVVSSPGDLKIWQAFHCLLVCQSQGRRLPARCHEACRPSRDEKEVSHVAFGCGDTDCIKGRKDRRLQWFLFWRASMAAVCQQSNIWAIWWPVSVYPQRMFVPM